ncbi:MAG TPA: FKBP-type peptidyl-prolyl cis-trans isomerase [Bacteroidales bacterium]|nr:FKBP-type peptidyl-prolyl cis-trans isomerase [Bacteroidales bacterium]HRZ77282.1 FKBP-type peptidyl-prolyl cis-trans isomerase [Bacteroidales bacterium]
MKTITRITLIAGAAVALLFSTSCAKKGGLSGFDQTESGLYYKFHVQNPDARKPIENDFITCIGIFTVKHNGQDTVFFDSRQNPNPYAFPIMPSSHKGDIFEGLKLMGLGDSASFAIPADSLFLRTFQTGALPEWVDSGCMAILDFKILKIQSREEFEAEMMAQAEAANPELAAARENEGPAMEAYLKDKKITTAPQASGLIYIERTAGKGAQAMAGKKVQVHYTGTLLDGTKFDSSVDRGQPFEFVLGQGQVIPGWDEGIALMREGGKAQFIIPSKLGYGNRDMGTIKPYSTLVFDVELIKVGE